MPVITVLTTEMAMLATNGRPIAVSGTDGTEYWMRIRLGEGVTSGEPRPVLTLTGEDVRHIASGHTSVCTVTRLDGNAEWADVRLYTEEEYLAMLDAFAETCPGFVKPSRDQYIHLITPVRM